MVLNEYILIIFLLLIFRKLRDSFLGEVIFSSFIFVDNFVRYFEEYLYENMNWENVNKARKYFI